LLKLPLKDQAERDDLAANVAAISRPADTTKLLARVAALLTPYYTGDVPGGVRMIDAEDWADALGEFPEWAIVKACRWWKSDMNDNRRKKPLEGDIVARIKFEMGAVKVAEWAIARFDRGVRPSATSQHRDAVSPENMEQRRKFAESIISSSFPSMRNER